ncbi:MULTISPECIES: hypothetical protein [Paraburkholderia]|uniref:hypothetical protein n=1 Tax=Paraburkholderia TaxID=1822464 RepID=UPI002AAF7156|nr:MULTISPECIES: hypothetical protein [Paraburkholderia]
MNGKLVMEVTVTELLSPLLFARLSACASPRERAAVFKACAEAHLRGERSVARDDAANVNDRHSGSPTRSDTKAFGRNDGASATAPTKTNEALNELGLQSIPIAHESEQSSVMTDALGDSLAGFL